MKAVRLRTEYLNNPIGIDVPRPRLFWNCEGGVTQSAYQITARLDGQTVWDTGKVKSSRMTGIQYEGPTLQSRQRIEWNVRLWDETDTVGESSSAYFEMGLLALGDWQAKWIAGDYKVNKKERYPADCFRRKFHAENIGFARLYVTACGLYEGCLNGRRIGDFVLAPGYTDYRKRIQYQTYDVTSLLRNGDNELTFMLADGWYRGSLGAWGLRNEFGTETKLLAQLELTAKDGTLTLVCTDGNWGWSNNGPIRFADNKDGEVYNANCSPAYNGRARETVCKVVPTASNNVHITEHESFKPAIITTPSGKTILDFHQNIAGYISFGIKGRQNQRIKLRFGEMLDTNGEFTQKNIQCSGKHKTTPLQQIIYTCREGVNEYKTRFAIFGFRYVLVETDCEIHPEDFTAIAVYSDMETTAHFDSSNDFLNRFVDATLWSAKNNSADIPTDCPTRERHGWTGDAQIFFNTAAYLLDYAPFARKYLRDVFDWQRRNGCLPQIAPYGGVDFYMNTMNGSVGWSDVGILMPWRFYRIYGDRQILSDNYDAMKKYAGFMISRIGKRLRPGAVYAKPTHVHGAAAKYIVNLGQSYGEWAEPVDVCPMKWTDMVQPHPEVSTAYTSFVLGIMADIAGTLGKTDDASHFRDISDKCRKAYQELVRTPEFDLNTDRQAQLVRPIYMKLLDEEQTSYARKRLIEALEHYGWRLGTGFLSTSLILFVLSEYNLDAAYRLLENEKMPGWLFMTKMGATTIWESWEGTQAQGGIASLDHYSKGACLEWVFSKMCGIQVDGENHFIIAPQPGGSFTHAELSYRSIYGEVFVRWEKMDIGYRYIVEVPANCTAELRLPGYEPTTISCQKASFENTEESK